MPHDHEIQKRILSPRIGERTDDNPYTRDMYNIGVVILRIPHK